MWSFMFLNDHMGSQSLNLKNMVLQMMIASLFPVIQVQDFREKKAHQIHD